MKIEFVKFKVRHKNLQTLAEQAVATVVKELLQIDQIELDIMLVSKFMIKTINKHARNINKVTDVLSFPQLPLTPNNTNNLKEQVNLQTYANCVNPETQNLVLGSLLICLLVVKKHAKEYENTLEREFAYMVVHGMLHLLGYDHIKDTDKKQMRAKEEKILKQMGLTRD